jgi:hypothetical protein
MLTKLEMLSVEFVEKDDDMNMLRLTFLTFNATSDDLIVKSPATLEIGEKPQKRSP